MKYLTIKATLPWGPAKKNSTRIVLRRDGKRTTARAPEYRSWEVACRELLWEAKVRLTDDPSAITKPCLVIVNCYPPSNRPDIHNQLDGVLDAMQPAKGQFGLIKNDRQVKQVIIQMVAIDSERPRLEVTVIDRLITGDIKINWDKLK